MTHYRVLKRFSKYTYIECQLETGRTHQIRVHMASIHHPLLGDTVYGPEKSPFHLQGQTLHAGVRLCPSENRGIYGVYSSIASVFYGTFAEIREYVKKYILFRHFVV